MFINSFCAVSHLGLIDFDTQWSLLSIDKNSDNHLQCKEPDYSKWLNPLQLRRMSKPVRMSVAAAKECMGNEEPGSIHVGTAYGILLDTEVFLKSTVVNQESMLTPTAFIQSTHNTVAGTIALAMKSDVHNMTFVHKAHSFEDALRDGYLLLEDDPDGVILVGSYEDLTQNNFHIIKTFNIYRNKSLAGEGAAFFKITIKKRESSIAEIGEFSVFRSKSKTEILQKVADFMEENKFINGDENIFLSGYLEKDSMESVYREIESAYFQNNEVIEFKRLCGEYPTASSFGLTYAASILKDNPKKICWMVNNFGSYWSIWLIKGMKS